MRRSPSPGHDEHVTDATRSSLSSETGDGSISEQKRLSARRRFLKGGVGGATAVVLSVYQRPISANSDRNGDRDRYDEAGKWSVDCPALGGKKVGVSVCISITGPTT